MLNKKAGYDTSFTKIQFISLCIVYFSIYISIYISRCYDVIISRCYNMIVYGCGKKEINKEEPTLLYIIGLL